MLCDYRKDDKCLPWTIKAQKWYMIVIKKQFIMIMLFVKIYDLPVLYIPKLSHPDPSVDRRRSGFLPPSFSDSKNLGSAIFFHTIWSVSNDKNFYIR